MRLELHQKPGQSEWSITSAGAILGSVPESVAERIDDLEILLAHLKHFRIGAFLRSSREDGRLDVDAASLELITELLERL